MDNGYHHYRSTSSSPPRPPKQKPGATIRASGRATDNGVASAWPNSRWPRSCTHRTGHSRAERQPEERSPRADTAAIGQHLVNTVIGELQAAGEHRSWPTRPSSATVAAERLLRHTPAATVALGCWQSCLTAQSETDAPTQLPPDHEGRPIRQPKCGSLEDLKQRCSPLYKLNHASLGRIQP